MNIFRKIFAFIKSLFRRNKEEPEIDESAGMPFDEPGQTTDYALTNFGAPSTRRIEIPQPALPSLQRAEAAARIIIYLNEESLTGEGPRQTKPGISVIAQPTNQPQGLARVLDIFNQPVN